MGNGRDAFTTDPVGFRLRLRNIQAGVWLGVCCCLFGTAYTALTWSQGHRTTVLAVSAVALAGSLLLSVAPFGLLLEHRTLRETLLLGYSALLVALFALAAAFDGGADSPLAVALVLPVVFAGLSSPFGAVLATGAMALAAYLALALGPGGASTADAFFFSAVLACSAWMGAWQARTQQLQRAELDRASRTDPLTGCLNRRGFEERFAVEQRRAERSGQPLAYLLIDLDSFKELNDLHGHAAGDEHLRWVVATLARRLGTGATVGRLGGDEFAVLVPGAGSREAQAVARAVGDALAVRAPASLGAAALPADGREREELHHQADLRLYAVKHGRSAVQVPARRRELSWATALAAAVDRRVDGGAHRHSEAVADLAAAVGRRLGWPEARLAQLRLAAILHDVGKVALPDDLLRADGPLADEELAIVRSHAALGAELVGGIEGLEALVPWIRHVHERVDGSGYPRGLAGEEIPLEARVIAVADAWDAMTSDRPHRPALGRDAALAELREGIGIHFDARCAELLLEELGAPAAAGVDAGAGAGAAVA